MKLNIMLRKTFLNEHHLNTVQPLVKKTWLFSLSGHLNQQRNFFTTKKFIRQISKYNESGNIRTFFVWIRTHISK